VRFGLNFALGVSVNKIKGRKELSMYRKNFHNVIL